MYIEPFAVEIWMNEWETECQWNLAETCVASLTINELMELAGKDHRSLADLFSTPMTYGAIRGSDNLRTSIATLYERQTIENMIVTHGTIGANALIHKTLVGAGDKVIAVVPTYQQHYSIPASIGADVQQLKLREENGFLPDLSDLSAMAGSDTRLIAINNPNNPTGALMDQAMLEGIVSIARTAGAWILCDEVYRGTDQAGCGTTCSIADIYEKGISTAGMSKAYSLAGLRLGWITAPQEAIEMVSIQRDYNTISVGIIDDYFATMALQNRARLLERSRAIIKENLAVLELWIAQESLISWTKPSSGTTALLKYDLPITSRELCVALLQQTGVMLTPGSALGMEGYLRIGYANSPVILKEGLKRVSEFLSRQVN